jgi:mono/diheme cytochrome c family protein
MMRRALTAILLVLAVAGCGSGADAPPPSPPAAPTGRELFGSSGCANCHALRDAGARGVVGPDLDELRPSEAAAIRQIRDGGSGMPPFRDALTPAQIRDLARYVTRVAGR